MMQPAEQKCLACGMSTPPILLVHIVLLRRIPLLQRLGVLIIYGRQPEEFRLSEDFLERRMLNCE